MGTSLGEVPGPSVAIGALAGSGWGCRAEHSVVKSFQEGSILISSLNLIPSSI